MKLRVSARCGAALTVMIAASRALASAPPPIVRVYVAGAPEAVSGARDAIQDVCSRSNVAAVVRDAAGADEALLATEPAPGLAEAYVDLRAGTPPRVVVVDSETRQDLERRTLPDGASLEISIETVARVVCSAVESSLAARAAAIVSAPPLPPAVAPAAKPDSAPLIAPQERAVERGSAWAPRVDLFGAAENFGAGFRGGGGGALGVTHGPMSVRVGALVSLAAYSAADVAAGSALASFGLIGLRAMPTLEWHASSEVTAFVGAGGGIDVTRIRAERAPLGGAETGASSKLDGVASGLLGTRLRVSRSLAVLFAVDTDVDLDRHRYVIASAGGTSTLFEPSRVRPSALVGLSLSFGGPDAGSTLYPEERR